jgi:hypothetical protein
VSNNKTVKAVDASTGGSRKGLYFSYQQPDSAIYTGRIDLTLYNFFRMFFIMEIIRLLTRGPERAKTQDIETKGKAMSPTQDVEHAAEGPRTFDGMLIASRLRPTPHKCDTEDE